MSTIQIYRLQNGEPKIQGIVGSPFEQTWDVIVVGGGTAGVYASLAAARTGCRVALFEYLTWVGGTGSLGWITSYYYGHPGGLTIQIDEITKEEHQKMYYMGQDLFAHTLEQALLQQGVNLMYETTVIGVCRKEDRICGIEWIDGDGSYHLGGCHVLIDATGNGDIAAMAGAEYEYGREWDGLAQPYSLTAVLSDGKTRLMTLNFDAGLTDPRNHQNLSHAVLHGYSLYDEMSHTDDNHLTSVIAPLPGIREARRFLGRDTLRFADLILHPRKIADPIFYAWSNIDTHSQDLAFETELVNDWMVVASLWGKEISIPVPLGTILPRDLEGLILAGRLLSVDHALAQHVRMRLDMQKCGEVAGYLAALAVQKGCAPEAISYQELLPYLTRTGCIIPEVHERPLSWMTQQDEIQKVLNSAQPGEAIWSCRILGKEAIPWLLEWIQERQPSPLREHAALALGLLQREEALSPLRDLAQQPNLTMMRSSRYKNHTLGEAAIYLLGKLRDPKSLEILLNHLNQIKPENSATFVIFAQTVMALIRLGFTYPEFQEKILHQLKLVFESPSFHAYLELRSAIPGYPFQLFDYKAYFWKLYQQLIQVWNKRHLTLPTEIDIPIYFHNLTFNFDLLR